ncbi:hypothetical protein [Rahnella aceris]
MSTKKAKEEMTETEVKEPKHEISEVEELKTCFIIMPISDHSDYEPGHFDRVYNYLIKPACLKAGYKPIRADDSKASNMIMFDILKKIVECDMAICDLSSRNANVFYELGLRQAFNKKTILVTDNKQPTPFDISSFRYVSYSSSLRVDTVDKEIPAITMMLKETESAPEDDFNSIVKLLKIRPAKVEPVDLSQEESVIYNILMQMQNQLTRLSSENAKTGVIGRDIHPYKNANKIFAVYSLGLILQNYMDHLEDFSFILDDKDLGKLIAISDDDLLFVRDDKETFSLPNSASMRNRIKGYESK